ncbi:unnamed protein product, partial [Vicia faba]
LILMDNYLCSYPYLFYGFLSYLLRTFFAATHRIWAKLSSLGIASMTSLTYKFFNILFFNQCGNHYSHVTYQNLTTQTSSHIFFSLFNLDSLRFWVNIISLSPPLLHVELGFERSLLRQELIDHPLSPSSTSTPSKLG